jgi:hypothetical protein
MSETKLTPNDPVEPELLQQLETLQAARGELALQMLLLEQDKVRLLASAHAIDEQTQRTFEKILVDRGMDPSTRVSIDASTGKLQAITGER